MQPKYYLIIYGSTKEMTTTESSAKRYRELAEEKRQLTADTITSPELRGDMLKLARCYDYLAAHAEANGAAADDLP
jgi:hypothetical protein